MPGESITRTCQPVINTWIDYTHQIKTSVLHFVYYNYSRIQICHCEMRNIDIGMSLTVLDLLAAIMTKTIWDT